jgi:predicted anti-sigma-YlaC factor YlaD
MGYIGNEPTTGHFPVDNFTSSGGSTYTLAKAPASAGAIEVSVQGVLQPTTAYTVSGTTLNMAGVTTGVKIFVRHLGETLVLPTIADGVVTGAKMAVNSVDGTKIAMGSDAAGDILYHGATDYARLAKGTAGQALVMNAGATAPEWGAAGGGKVLQVVEANQTALVQTTSQSFVDLTGMTLAITPAATSSKILVFAFVNSSATNGANWVAFKLVRDSTSLLVGDAASSRIVSQIAQVQASASDMASGSMSALDSPSSTSALTYKVQWKLRNTSGGSANLNSTDTDTDNNTFTRGASNIVAMEIGV